MAGSLGLNRELLVPLSYYGRFSRGIATGANDFFVLRPSRARRLELGIFDVRPCVTKARQIRNPVFREENYVELGEQDEAVLLFSPNGVLEGGGAKAYVRYGQELGYNRRYLTKSRHPWYKTERRDVSGIWMSVFSRGGYKVVRNYTRSATLTCFHGFVPKGDAEVEVDRLFLYLFSEVGRSIVALSSRRYGRQLDKFEPNDLNNALVPCSEVFAGMGRDKVEEAVREIEVRGNSPEWVESSFGALTGCTDAMVS